jgi:cytochrome P450
MLDAKDEVTGEKLDDETIIDQCLTMFLAGHDTTAHTMSWIFHLVSQHPEVEAKIIEEVDFVFDGKERLSYQDIGKLTYLTAVIKEALRMFGPARK